jgi:hypothetical protein
MARQFGGMSAVTRLAAPIVVPAPIVTPGSTIEPAPSHTRSPIVIGRAWVR